MYAGPNPVTHTDRASQRQWRSTREGDYRRFLSLPKYSESRIRFIEKPLCDPSWVKRGRIYNMETSIVCRSVNWMAFWQNDMLSMMILIFIQTVIVTVNMDMFVQTCLGEQESEQMVSPFYKFCSNHFGNWVIHSAQKWTRCVCFINHRGEQTVVNWEGVMVAACRNDQIVYVLWGKPNKHCIERVCLSACCSNQRELMLSTLQVRFLNKLQFKF